MTAPAKRARRSLIAWLFDPLPICLDLTDEEIMADLDPGWLVWQDRSEEDDAHGSQAA